MKIQQLTIHNIASFEDAAIDFEASPLAECEVFLITGQTGAGKSTILDAICLALYADTPRLDGTLMDGGTKDGDNNVSIDDPRQLMRKNTGEAFASLTFIGSNGIHYKATWSVARAYKKPTGKLQPKEWVWENLDTGTKLTKDAEIKKEMEGAIGLDFEQFRRTTLLAQGEFTRFLNSPDKDKADILEKITGVDVYSKIGKKIYEVTSKKYTAWDTAQKLADATPNPSDDDIVLKQEEIKALETQREAYARLQDKDKGKLQWIKTDKECSERLASAEKAYEVTVKETESEAFKAKETLVRQWDETIDARGWIRAKKDAEAEVARQKGVLMTLSQEFADVLGGYEFTAQEKQQAEAERDKLPKVNPEEETNASQQLAGLRRQRDEAKDLLQNIATACDRIESYTTARDRREQTGKALEEASAEIEKKKEESSKMEPQLHEAKTKMDTCKEMLDRQSDTIDKFAQTMRQRLKTGDVCPVCRQKITGELPHEEELAQLVGGLRSAFTEAESAYKELEKKKNKLDAEIQAATSSYQRNKEAFDKDNSLTIAKQKVIEACKACGIETIEKTTPQTLESLGTQTRSTIQVLEAQITGLEKQVAAYQKAAKERGELEVKLANMTSQCKMAKDALEEILQLKPDWKTLTPSTEKRIPDLPKKANDLKSRTSTTLDRLEQAEEAIKRNDQQLDAFLLGHEDIEMGRLVTLDTFTPQAISEVKASLEQVRNSVLAAKTLKEEAVRKLKEHRSTQPELTENDTIEALEARINDCETTMTGLVEKKGSLLQALITDESNRKRHGQLEADAERKKSDYDKWERMNQYIGDSTGNKFRKIAQSYVLSSLIHSANSYMSTLTDRYMLKVTPGTFVITIEDAYQGFASRAVSTISGGESFLVSLSLALALSDIGQRLSVDILFIDEGFGTLSGEPLQNAVNTLRTLHTKAGRRVGIISHVEELKNKNLVQILVEQDGKNSSRSTIKIDPEE